MNKVNTKAELRFHLGNAQWIPEEVKERLKEQNSNRINQLNEFVISSQEHRTQINNKKECIVKLKHLLIEAYIEPKDRIINEKLDIKAKKQRFNDRKHRSSIKQNRRR